jgi:hypothetical protein
MGLFFFGDCTSSTVQIMFRALVDQIANPNSVLALAYILLELT